MKAKSIITCLLLCSGLSAPASVPEGGIELVPVEIEKGYLPVGFDDNDVTQVVVAGNLPDTCYKLGPVSFEVDAAKKRIAVRQTAYHTPGVVCIRVFVPFMNVVNVGIVRAGVYAVADRTSGRELGTLPVEIAHSAAQDDYLYAPVADAVVRKDAGAKQATLLLSGNFTDRCTRIKEVRVHYYPEIVIVQPIAERIGAERDCGYEKIRFQYPVKLQEGLKGTYLMHVRSMNGQALNKLAEVE